MHNRQIARKLSAKKVLDVGCGYGALVDFLRSQDFQPVGIDPGADSISVARELFPSSDLRLADPLRLEFEDGAFDHVVLKDALHHVVEYENRSQMLEEIVRVLAPGGTLIIFDPNPQLIVRICRWLARHKDPECSPALAVRLLQEHGTIVRSIEYYECVALPLSGGYVGLQLWPNVEPLVRLLVWCNHVTSLLINRIGIGPYVLWRYLICAQKPDR